MATAETIQQAARAAVATFADEHDLQTVLWVKDVKVCFGTDSSIEPVLS